MTRSFSVGNTTTRGLLIARKPFRQGICNLSLIGPYPAITNVFVPKNSDSFFPVFHISDNVNISNRLSELYTISCNNSYMLIFQQLLVKFRGVCYMLFPVFTIFAAAHKQYSFTCGLFTIRLDPLEFMINHMFINIHFALKALDELI